MAPASAVLVVAVPAALVGAASMGLASAAQAQATKEVPTTRTLNPRLLVRLAHRPLWLVGIVATLGGLGLQVVALGYGPLILVQPLLVTALPFASVFAAAMTHRRVDRVTVLGCLVCVAGLSSFLLLARPSDDGSDGMVEADRVLPLALALAVLMLLGLAVSSAVRGSVRVLGLALATGVMYGVTAGLIKIVAGQLRLGLTEPFTHWALYTVCVIGPIGFLLSQNTFQQGLAISPALAVITTVDPLVGVAIGVWWMGESATTGGAVLGGELLAAAVIVAGIAILAWRTAHMVTGAEKSVIEKSIADKSITEKSGAKIFGTENSVVEESQRRKESRALVLTGSLGSETLGSSSRLASERLRSGRLAADQPGDPGEDQFLSSRVQHFGPPPARCSSDTSTGTGR
ncbi:MAG TPA: DMT family transporter [Pseudonocardiaceae bacterium]